MTVLLPEKTTGNQIVNVLIKKRRTKLIKVRRSHRGANVDPDHILVNAKLKLNIKSSKGKRRKWKVKELKLEEKNREYREKITLELENNREGQHRRKVESTGKWHLRDNKNCIRAKSRERN